MIRSYIVTTETAYDDGPCGGQPMKRNEAVEAYTAEDAVTQVELRCFQSGYWRNGHHYHPRVIGVAPAGTQVEAL